MKSATGPTVWSYKIHWLAFAVTFLLAVPVFSLHMTDMPQNMQTKVQEPRERAISLKLPLLQPTFHWTFMSRADFLSGKLILRIVRNSQSNEIVIFENGQFTDGWESMSLPPVPGKGEIYFGFTSTRTYLTAPGDKLELELTVTKDLPGIGARQTGILPAGKYTSKGTYSGLIDEYDTTLLAKELAKEGKRSLEEQQALLNKLRAMYEYKAFLESWTDQWPLKITGEKGWLPDKKASAYKAMPEERKLNVKAEPPVASTDSVVTNEKPSRKYLCYWLIIPIVALFVVIAIQRAFTKQ
jgi:hypothetical protein